VVAEKGLILCRAVQCRARCIVRTHVVYNSAQRSHQFQEFLTFILTVLRLSGHYRAAVPVQTAASTVPVPTLTVWKAKVAI
jgi:hypothetical protein